MTLHSEIFRVWRVPKCLKSAEKPELCLAISNSFLNCQISSSSTFTTGLNKTIHLKPHQLVGFLAASFNQIVACQSFAHLGVWPFWVQLTSLPSKLETLPAMLTKGIRQVSNLLVCLFVCLFVCVFVAFSHSLLGLLSYFSHKTFRKFKLSYISPKFSSNILGMLGASCASIFLPFNLHSCLPTGTSGPLCWNDAIPRKKEGLICCGKTRSFRDCFRGEIKITWTYIDTFLH